ncbi:MAG: reverse transcriptase/maturase family protein [Synergistaceae bacterium]|jgi:retron-type reverse transcriptase|nr:reverse transcriptase/maturase family protein [Synergistaceae bacterium]
MKSYTDLYQKICTFSAIYRAYQLCRRGKREREYAIEFEKDLETNIFNLRDDLVSGRWTPGQYSRFFVEDPKRRLINAPPYKDRVIHQAVSSAILPIWEPMFIRDTYACLTGRGTHLAVDRLQQFMRRYPKGTGYVLQLDVKSYFASIDHEILLNLLSERIRDWKMMRLIRLIVESYEDMPGVGIPLGNLTSQGFANIYLHELDMFAKHGIKIKQYLRYMDDITLVHGDKTQLWEWRDEIEAYLADHLHLQLHPDKQVLAPIDRGVKYLGYWVYRDHIRALARNVRRVYQRLRQMESGTYKGDARASISSWIGYVKHADTYGLKCRIAERHPYLRVAFEPIEELK